MSKQSEAERIYDILRNALRPYEKANATDRVRADVKRVLTDVLCQLEMEKFIMPDPVITFGDYGEVNVSVELPGHVSYTTND
jgi:hypothetical protein